MANAAVVECYATLVDPFNSTAGRDTPHRGADYRRADGQKVVAYEKCTVINSDLKSSFLGYSVVAKRARDGKYIGWAHLKVGTRPGAGTVLNPGDQVGLVAGWNDYHGSSWSGAHIHTTEGSTTEHIYSGTNSDPHPDIVAAKGGTAGTGGSAGVVNYAWWQITPAAQGQEQRLLNHIKLYGGVDGGTGPVDDKAGENTIKGMQEYLKRRKFLPGDYEVDGIPHNPDQNAPSNFGYALQKWVKADVAYPGKEDGLPGSLTSEYIVKAVNKIVGAGTVTPPPIITPPTTAIPNLPMVPVGFFFAPDLATSQGMFDFAEYSSKGGRAVKLKMGGSNASDSPYIAPAYKDQLDRARKQNQKITHYWFNGDENNVTPELAADFYSLHAEVVEGDVHAIDIEDETATGTKAWTVAEAVRYVKQLQTHFPNARGLFYLSESVYKAHDWSPLEALGWERWIAKWGSNSGDPEVNPEGDEFVWQYTSKEKVPGNYTGTGTGRVYGDTDGNICRGNLYEVLGWKIPVVVDPDPEVPADSVQTLQDYFVAQAKLNAEFAALLN